MFNRLSNAPNRTILYDLYNYICDIKSGVSLARAFVNSLGKSFSFITYIKENAINCSILNYLKCSLTTFGQPSMFI